MKPSHPKTDAAKLKALRLVQQKGPLKACDPNNPVLKPSTPELQAKVRKRALGSSDDSDVPHVDTPRPTKRSKAEIDDLLEAKSSHAELINEFEEQQSEQYFSKLERKEQLENKMLETFEIKTTAVTCPKVKCLKFCPFSLLNIYFCYCSVTTLPCQRRRYAGKRVIPYAPSKR